jgi:hypothetical protein
MTDEKVYHAEEITDNPLPNEVLIDIPTSQSLGKDVYNPATVKNNPLPLKRVAVELIGSVLNTVSRKILGVFEFTKMGAIQIGEYLNGVSGDVKISPNGITARDSSGLTTFNLDGTTGNAVFKGTVQAGTIISGAVAVGDGNILIDGETKRMIFYDDNNIPVIVIGEV